MDLFLEPVTATKEICFRHCYYGSVYYYGSVSLDIFMDKRLPIIITATEGVFHGHYYYGAVSGAIAICTTLYNNINNIMSPVMNDRLQSCSENELR